MAIRKRDLEITKKEQTPEAHAFMLRRTEEKLQHLEFMTMEMVQSKTVSAKDRLEAISFLRQLYTGLLSLFLYGRSKFLIKEASSSSFSTYAPRSRPYGFETEGGDKWDNNDDNDDDNNDPKEDRNKVF